MAQNTYEGDNWNKVANIDATNGIYNGRWKGAFRGAKNVNVGEPGNTPAAERAVIANIEKQMREYGGGSRAVVQVFYRGGGGHVFNIENDRGRIIWVEAQTGEMKNIERTMQHVDTGSVNLVRLDNLRVSDRAKEFVRPDRETRRRTQ